MICAVDDDDADGDVHINPIQTLDLYIYPTPKCVGLPYAKKYVCKYTNMRSIPKCGPTHVFTYHNDISS